MYDRSDDYYEAKDKIAHLESLTAELAAMLGELEWAGLNGDDTGSLCCPSCHKWYPDGHSPDCRLSALLARARGTKGAADER